MLICAGALLKYIITRSFDLFLNVTKSSIKRWCEAIGCGIPSFYISSCLSLFLSYFCFVNLFRDSGDFVTRHMK